MSLLSLYATIVQTHTNKCNNSSREILATCEMADNIVLFLQISILNAAFNPVENCPVEGAVFDPYDKTHLAGEITPDKYPLGDWQNRFDNLTDI